MAKKDFASQLQTAVKQHSNTVEGTPLMEQHDEVIEEELQRQQEPAPAAPVAPIASVVPAPAAPVASTEKTKGIVVDVPLSLYYRLRNLKDSRPNESFKSLALQAIIEYVDRQEAQNL